MGYSVDILNNIRANASDEYANKIPQATRENFSQIGNALQTYEPLFNEYKTALIHKIGKTIIQSKLFKNRLARFKSGGITDPKDVEEIFVDMAKGATAFDPNGSNPLGRRNDDNVKVVYHRLNRQDTYDFTIGDLDFLKAFKSEGAHDKFILAIINSNYSRANYDEYVHMKNLLATYDGWFNYGVPVIAGDDAGESAKTFVKTLRKAITDLSFVSNKYNKMGVYNQNEHADSLALLIHKDVVAEVDVEVLAKAFNLGKTDIQVEIIVLDDFGTLANTYGLLIDKELFKVLDTLFTMTSQYNAQGMFTNYFLQVQQILSLSPFMNSVRFTTDTVSA